VTNSSTQTDCTLTAAYYGSIESWNYDRVNEHNVSTQVRLEIRERPKPATTIEEIVSTDKTPIFRGPGIITSDEKFQSVAGVSREIFQMLLRFMDGYVPHAFTVENQKFCKLSR
jgi:hypothetical protein